MLSNKSIKLLYILFFLVLSACKEGSTNPAEKTSKDANNTKTKDASMAQVNDSSMQPISDIGEQVISVRVTPSHMTTDIEPEKTISLLVSFNRVDPASLEKILTSKVTLLTWPGKKLVPTTLSLLNGPHAYSRNGKLKPGTPLTKDAEYLIYVDQSGLVKSTREYTQFRVGPLTRIYEIRFHSSTQDPDVLEDIVILFSGKIDHQTLFQTTNVTNEGTSKTISMTLDTPSNPDLSNSGATLRFPQGQKMNDRISITIGTDLGGPSMLDGLYTGKAGSGPFKLEIVPQDTCTPSNCKWTPELSY